MAREVNNQQDIIDSRDIIARIEDLESEREALVSDVDEKGEALESARFGDASAETLRTLQGEYDDAERELAEWDESAEAQELKALKAFADEASGYASDWHHGETCIRESYFPDYCQELCENIGDIPKNLPHYIVIDWDATAENIKADYAGADFDGETYLVRCS